MTFVGQLGGPWGTMGDFSGHLGVPEGQWMTFVGHLGGRWRAVGDFFRSLGGSLEDNG